MPPPTHSIAAVPTSDRKLSSRGISHSSAVPERARARVAALAQVQADVVHLHDHRDRAVDAEGDRHRDQRQHHRLPHQVHLGQLGQRDGHDLGREDEVGADRAADLAVLELLGIGDLDHFLGFAGVGQHLDRSSRVASKHR